MSLRVLACLVGGFLFLASMAGYLYAQLYLKRKYDSDLDDYYHEVEESHPALARYYRWSRLCLAGAALGAVLLFAAAYV